MTSWEESKDRSSSLKTQKIRPHFPKSRKINPRAECFLEISGFFLLLKSVCVTKNSLCFFGVMMCFLNLSWRFSLVRWVIATHLEKYMLVKLKVFFPNLSDQTRQKEVSIKCLKLISTNNFRTYIIYLTLCLRFWAFFTMWYKSYVTIFCNNYTLRGIFLQVVNNSSGARVNDSTIREEIIPVSSKIGRDQRSKSRVRWRMVQLQQKVGSFCLCSWLILGRFF